MPEAVNYACALGEALNTLDGVRVNPEMPQVAMFHLHFALKANELSEKITDYASNTGVVLLPLPRAEMNDEA
ncbi:threonine aldolase, partial [Pseudoalteromonas sp. SIMBA_153]